LLDILSYAIWPSIIGENETEIVPILNPLMPTVAICNVHYHTCIQHTVPDRIKPSFVIFDI